MTDLRIRLYRAIAESRERRGRDRQTRAMERLAAAMQAQQSAAASLPPGIDPSKLADLQEAFDTLKKKARGKEPSKAAVQRKSGLSRTVVREYWSYLRT